MANRLGIIYILDRNYDTLGLIDQYYSLIWTVRFRGEGEFELELPPDPINRTLLQMGRYLQEPDNTRDLMIVEEITIDSDLESGARLKVKGRSLESILRYQIAQVVHNGEEKVDYISLVLTVLKENLVNPVISAAQQLPTFSVSDSRPTVKKPNVEATIALPIDGNNIYELIDQCAEYFDIGWRIRPDYRTKGAMVFEFYDGIDRTFSQTAYPWVIFSPSYDNLISSNYYTTHKDYFNVAYVKSPEGGVWLEDEEGELSPQAEEAEKPGGGGGGGITYPIRHSRSQFYMTVYTEATEPAGLDRRAVYLDLSSEYSWEIEDKENELYTEEQMRELLRSKALLELSEMKKTEAFDGEVETLRQFTYGVDFVIGDICQMKNEFGLECAIRIAEVVQSMDDNGYSLVPTFTKVEWHA